VRGELRAREPALTAVAAFWSERSGIVDVAELLEALARDTRAHGGQLVLGQRCTGLRQAPQGWELWSSSPAMPRRRSWRGSTSARAPW
jgi:L-2-hydroxyglutarate oxidase LhgO